MEVKDFCRNFIKLLFIIFNVIAALMGFIISILGIVSWLSSRYLYITELSWVALPIFLIFAGLVLIAFAGFGVIGAMFEYKCCLIIYMFGLTASIALIFILCVSGFIWGDVLDGAVHESLERNLNLTDYNVLVDKIQEYEQCCGVENYTDWYNTVWALNHTISGIAVPKSCCKDEKSCSNGEDGEAVNTNEIHKEGCYQKVVSYITEYYYRFILAILVFCLFLTSGEIVTWYLLCTSPSESSGSIFKRKNRYMTV